MYVCMYVRTYEYVCMYACMYVSVMLSSRTVLDLEAKFCVLTPVLGLDTHVLSLGLGLMTCVLENCEAKINHFQINSVIRSLPDYFVLCLFFICGVV